MGGVTVVVGTYGDEETWGELAHARAIPSAEHQAPVVYAHAATLAECRNYGLERVDTERVVFLDADDELEPGYIDALEWGAADIRVPSVAYVRGGRRRAPYVPTVPGHQHECTGPCLEHGNFAVIGSMATTELARAVGGFHTEEIYEDWALWLRMYRAGATVETIPEAVYRAHVRPDSRNRAQSMDFKNDWHHRIAEAA